MSHRTPPPPSRLYRGAAPPLTPWRHRTGLGVVLALACALLLAFGEPEPRAPALPEVVVDHRPYTEVLRTHVRQGRVNYGALRADRGALDAYLTALGAVPKSAFDGWARQEQLAFLLNLYNAATLQLIIDHPGVGTIRDIGGAEGPWHLARVVLFGAVRTLDAIEHELIRPGFAEPRVHFALVCAAQSCPHLRPEAYEGARLETQLEEDTRVFIRRTTSFDPERRTLIVSALFEWFTADFAREGGVMPFLARYLEPLPGSPLPTSAVTLQIAPYDWGLNGSPP